MKQQLTKTDLYFLDNLEESRRLVEPVCDRFHSIVKVLHIFRIQLEKWSKFSHNIPKTWILISA